MDVLQIKVFTELGKPVALGRFGTATISGVNDHGQVCLEVTLDNRMLKRMARKSEGRFDKRRKAGQ